jgi:cation:H+ antiporter
VSAILIWFAGIRLSETADILATHFNLGEALGGLILLAIVTNLPEIAITVSAALQHHLELALGNILGGIAIQTVVLVLLDVFGLGKKDPLTYRAASLILVLEGLMVITVLTLVVVGNQLRPSVIFMGVSPIDAIIVLVCLAGIYMIGKARTNLPWHQLGVLPDSQKEQRGHSMKMKHELAMKKGMTI